MHARYIILSKYIQSSLYKSSYFVCQKPTMLFRKYIVCTRNHILAHVRKSLNTTTVFRYTLSDLHYRRITFKRKRQKSYSRIDFALGFPLVNVSSEDLDKVIFRCKSVISDLFLCRVNPVDTARSQYDFGIRQTDTRKSRSAVAN